MCVYILIILGLVILIIRDFTPQVSLISCRVAFIRLTPYFESVIFELRLTEILYPSRLEYLAGDFL